MNSTNDKDETESTAVPSVPLTSKLDVVAPADGIDLGLPTWPRDPRPATDEAVATTGWDAPSNPYNPRHWPIWGKIGGSILVILVLASALMAFIRIPYYAIAPGSVRETGPRVEIGSEVFIADGEIGFVTVSLTDSITLWQWVDAKLDDKIEIVPEELINGDGTSDEKREEDQRRMQESKDAAVVVALRYLDLITEVGLGIEVAQLIDCLPAQQVLNQGDVILAIDGVETLRAQDLLDYLATTEPGQNIEVVVDRIDPDTLGSAGTEIVRLEMGSSWDPCLAAADAEAHEESLAAPERSLMGIYPREMLDLELPFNVDIDTDRVGGPSAGLAFTLTIIDLLTEGELTGGEDIAVTGAIDSAGNVLPVGGLTQKTAAVERAGYDLFIVPSGNYETALAAADDLEIVPVDTLEDAIAVLESRGGDPAMAPAGNESAAGN